MGTFKYQKLSKITVFCTLLLNTVVLAGGHLELEEKNFIEQKKFSSILKIYGNYLIASFFLFFLILPFLHALEFTLIMRKDLILKKISHISFILSIMIVSMIFPAYAMRRSHVPQLGEDIRSSALPYENSVLSSEEISENLDKKKAKAPLKRKQVDEENERFVDLKRYKRSQDDQARKLTVRSPYVKGDFCALVRWVSDLSIYYGSKNPQKTVRVPSYDIHQTLALIGNHLKACYEISDTRSSASKRNILVPFVSFVAKSNDGPRQFFEGDYLRFEDDERALAFISGPQSYSTEIYDQYTGYYNPIAEKKNFEQLPPIKMIAGDTASWFCEKDFSQINDECARKRKEKAYQFHTEEWLHEILNAEPQLAIDSVTRSLSPNDKVYAIIFDMYSLWDVCEHCQKKFKGELFSRKTITYLQNLLKAKNLKYPKNGIKVVFRVSSEQAYFSDITSEQLKYAGGGYNAEEGFDIKIIDSSQVSLCARQSPTYKEVSENVYRVISQIFKEEYW